MRVRAGEKVEASSESPAMAILGRLLVLVLVLVSG